MSSMSMPNREEVLEALKPVVDPEMNVSIVDLGLVYDVEAEEDEQSNPFQVLEQLKRPT